MRIINFGTRLLACVAILTLATMANADVWDEISDGGGDAGDFPNGSFQSQTGSSAFDQITGNNLDGIDSYLITVTDASSFYIEDVDTSGSDTLAFVWGVDGTPIWQNDDNAGPGAQGFSFGFGNPGITHLGPLEGNPQPVSDGDQIILSVGAFGDAANGNAGGEVFVGDGGDFTSLRGPTGQKFTSYTALGAGSYDIRLTGAIFGKAIPEPSSLGLFALGLVAVVTRRRK